MSSPRCTPHSLVAVIVEGVVRSSPRSISGPFAGWEPYRLVVGPSASWLLLWKHTGGQISIWQLDASGKLLGSQVYGPFAGWSVTHVTASAGGKDELAISWKRTDGALSLWSLESDGSQLWSSAVHGPYAGWTPAAAAVDRHDNRYLLWTTPAGVAGLWSIPWPYYIVSTEVHGPLNGWTPRVLAAGSPDDSSRLLWRHTRAPPVSGCATPAGTSRRRRRSVRLQDGNR